MKHQVSRVYIDVLPSLKEGVGRIFEVAAHLFRLEQGLYHTYNKTTLTMFTITVTSVAFSFLVFILLFTEKVGELSHGQFCWQKT